jgi:uncharacterized membrane protein YbhN (UPF0104 family)
MAMSAVRTRRVALGAVLLAGCAGLLAYQLRDVDFGSLFAQVSPAWVVAAVGAIAVSLGAAAHNISAFAPVRLRAVDTLRAQLAVGGLRIVAPSAVSTPAIGTRLLVRRGLPLPTALTTVALAQTAQLIMTIVVVAAIALVASAHLPTPGGAVLLVLAAVLVGLAVAALAARRVPALRRGVARGVDAVRTIGSYLRSHPLRLLTGLGAAAALTVLHVAGFVCCVHAVGGDGSVLALTAVYLGAASAGSLIPTPGGVGAVETAMISGLVAAGLSAQTATAAALLSRLVTVWLPAVPGLFALRSLRREGLV